MVLSYNKISSKVRGGDSFTKPAAERVRVRRAIAVNCDICPDTEAEDVIDLGAPIKPRRPAPTHRLPRLYTPNPRLYPGATTKSASRRRAKLPAERNPRQRKRKFVRPVPNSRLYRPGTARVPLPPPPPDRPRAAWPPPVERALESASSAALRALQSRGRGARRALGAGAAAPGVRAGAAAQRDMAAGKHSASPDCSDGNDASSAPSEFLAEFLSAIMRRQYAEALKYCQLILQYEPHNSTARGFYPLLQHKLRAPPALDTSSSEGTEDRRLGAIDTRLRQRSEAEEGSAAEEMDEGSGSACSSLELDSSSSPSPRGSPPPRARFAPRSPASTEPSDPTDPTDPSDSASWRWDSGARDDNGNPPRRCGARGVAEAECAPGVGGAVGAGSEDLQNDNAATSLVKSADSALQRLRARFVSSSK